MCIYHYIKWYRQDNPAYRASSMRLYRRKQSEVLAAYGNACACCGETEKVFLAIDHINGNRNIHRRSLSRDGKTQVSNGTFYGWLIKNKFPQGFRVLCHNCNFAMANGGCPHQRQ